MQDQNYKCSKHKDIDSIKCCGECKAYYCNKCEKLHSELHENHQTFQIDKDTEELFTGFCQENDHQKILYYHCKDHNTLSVLLVSERSKQEKMENIMIVMYVI